ncbi:MAG: radical SAM protein [Clostridia bacterium]|nr:radical SAM protein [Clostridia bacterium]
MKRINVIIKVTDGCNLRCKYCYNSESCYTSEILPLERFEKLLTLLSDSFDSIALVWHGGEPMTCGLEYFKKVVEIEDRIYAQTSVPIQNTIQTNGTLIDKKWCAFFKKYRFNVGVSFDGINNDRYRQRSEDTLKAMELMQKEKVPFGCLTVVGDNDYDMFANYRYFAEKGIHVAFTPLFAEGGGVDLEPLSAEVFIKKSNELFDYWLYDKNGVNVRTFSGYISMLLGSHSKLCTNGSCLGKWLGIEANGNLYNCGRDSMKEFCFGNIDAMDDISEAFTSDGFRELLIGSIERRKKCKASCEFFDFCEGGCTDCAILENGIDAISGFSCICFREIFRHIREAVQVLIENKVPLSELNPVINAIAVKCLSEKDDE